MLQGDGAHLPTDPVDAIYVNAGVTRPADNWLARLNDGGRLIIFATASSVDRSQAQSSDR
jgi:protein-L-isoaspartate(D-aspartate) O-methyltransferase